MRGLSTNVDGMHIDISRLERALKVWSKNTSRTVPQIVNQAAYDVCVEATKLTPKTPWKRITTELNKRVVPRPWADPKTGRMIQGKPRPLGEIIAITRMRKKQPTGKLQFTKSSIREEANAIKKARMQGVGFVASGWVSAALSIQRFAIFKAKFGWRKGIPLHGKKKGKAVPSPKETLRPFAVIENNVHGVAVVERKHAPLAKAIRIVSRQIGQRISKRMAKEADNVWRRHAA